MDARFTATISKIQPENRRWWGWAYISKRADGSQVVDHSGDVVDTDETRAALEDAFYRYVRDSGAGDDQHQFFGSSRVIEALAMTKDKAALMGIDQDVPEGLWVGFEATDTPQGDELWSKIKSGDRRQMSIVGRGREV